MGVDIGILGRKQLICERCKKEKRVMMNVWHEISRERITPEEFVAVIEISHGGKNKYELDKDTGMLILDRVLYTSTHYPANYGFIPRTYAGDKDPLDVLVICSEKIQPMTLVKCKPIGVIKMEDHGDVDEKIIAVSLGDPSNAGFNDSSELPKHMMDEIIHFFQVYKALENRETSVSEMFGRDEAVKIIEDCIEMYNQKFGYTDR